MLIDAHCHLEVRTLGADVPVVLERARLAGVAQLVAVGSSGVAAGAAEAIALAEAHDFVFATAGIHPHEAGAARPEDLHAIERALGHPRVVACGEIGLDYHYDFSARPAQHEVFMQQLAIAKRLVKPIMLHVREAHADTLRCLDEAGISAASGVVHCFTSGPAEAEAFLARGLYLSIPGVVTFKNAAALQEAVRQAPLDRLLVETDSPYLAPVPHRGKRNEPAWVVHTAQKVAELRGVTFEEVAAATTANARRLFGLPSAP